MKKFNKIKSIPKSSKYTFIYNEDFKKAEQESYENFKKIINDNKSIEENLQEIENFLNSKR